MTNTESFSTSKNGINISKQQHKMYWSYEYMRAAGWNILSKEIIAFIEATFAVAKRKPETFSLVWDSNPWTRDTGAALFLQNVAYLNKPCVHKLMLLCITSRISKAVTSSLSTTPFSYYWCTSSTPRTSSALILANSRFVIKHSTARRIFNSLLGVSSASHAWYILKSSANK